jgi:hypothetical protein
MKKLSVLALALLLTTQAASAIPYPPKPVPIPTGGTSSAAGVAGVTGFLGFVGFLVLYDLWRRNNCAGDVLGLGGPGFTTPSNPYQNVMLTVNDRGLCRPKAIRVRG